MALIVMLLSCPWQLLFGAVCLWAAARLAA